MPQNRYFWKCLVFDCPPPLILSSRALGMSHTKDGRGWVPSSGKGKIWIECTTQTHHTAPEHDCGGDHGGAAPCPRTRCAARKPRGEGTSSGLDRPRTQCNHHTAKERLCGTFRIYCSGRFVLCFLWRRWFWSEHQPWLRWVWWIHRYGSLPSAQLFGDP